MIQFDRVVLVGLGGRRIETGKIAGLQFHRHMLYAQRDGVRHLKRTVEIRTRLSARQD
jgi:hypothetical protein